MSLANDLRLEIRSGADRVVYFTADQIEAIGMHEIRTETTWYKGERVFAGPLLRHVLDKASYTAASFRARALNNYSAIVPVSDAHKYDVIIATRIDGERLSVRSKGPFWIIYPFSEARLSDMIYLTRSVWQLNVIERDP